MVLIFTARFAWIKVLWGHKIESGRTNVENVQIL